MKPFSDRSSESSSENLLSQMVQSLKERGISYLDLTVSNPTQCGFHYLNEDLLSALKQKGALSYRPDPRGLIEAREAISAYYKKRNIHISPDDLVITASTSEAYGFLFKLLANAGDTILAPKPSYPILDYLMAHHDLKVSKYPLYPELDWNFSADEIGRSIDANQARAILAVNPNNPTGNYFSGQSKHALEKLAQKHHVPLISDEVFFDFPIHSGKYESFIETKDALCFTLNGISKTLGLPQMKLSWIVISGPADLKKEAVKRLEIISDTYLSVSTPIQLALSRWLRESEQIQNEIKERIQANFKRMDQMLREIPGVRVYPPQGGWCAAIRLSETLTDEEWAIALLKEANVLTHPGYLFDFEEESFVVVSLLTPAEKFEEGLRRVCGLLRRGEDPTSARLHPKPAHRDE